MPRRLVLLLLLVGLARCARPGASPPPTIAAQAPLPAEALPPAEALAAFARLYGAVRWFHPSDEAALADWSALAVAGAEAALDADSPDALREGLMSTFGPWAPTVQVWPASTPAPARLVPAGPGPALVWQHLGWSFGGDQPIYRATRVGRAGPTVRGADGVVATNGDVAEALRGRRIRVSARIRIDAPEGPESPRGSLWLRLDHGPRDEAALRVGWDDALPVDGAWHPYEVVADVPDDATWYVFGARLVGRGTLWADDFALAVLEPDGRWRSLPVQDARFDDPERWWTFDGLGYDTEVVEDAGDPALRLTHQDLLRAPLFAAEPSLGEAMEGPIGAGLVARVPLALPLEPERPPLPAPPAVPRDRDDAAVRTAAVLVAWNVLRHFHPYEAELHVDWEAVLQRALTRALAAPDRPAVVEALWGLLHDVPDGHGWAAHPSTTPRRCALAVRWVRTGEALVVTNSGEPEVAVGDLVRAVDGLPVADALARARGHTSGSPHFRDAFAAERLAFAPCGTASTLTLERAGAPLRVTLAHAGAAPPLFDHPGVEDTPGGIVLVDLNVMDWEALQDELPALAAARGVVFDLREYPAKGVTQVLRHLLSAPDAARAWMRIPQIVRPGEVAGWEAHDWRLTPASPHIGGEVVFLTSPLSISAAESILALARAEGVATLVGERTAGTNGNATGAVLPGGYVIQFTGMRVVHPDGAPLHLVGVPPDVPVTPTLAGLQAGRDEVRDAAVAWLQGRPR